MRRIFGFGTITIRWLPNDPPHPTTTQAAAIWAMYVRLLSLPQRDQAREIVSAPTAIGRRLTNALGYAGRTETLDAELLQEKEAEAKAEAEKDRPGLTMFTNGSRLDSGAAGYDTRWRGRGARPGWASKPTRATTRRPMAQSAPRLQGRWNRLHEGRQRRSGSRFSQTPKPLADGWRRRSLVPANNSTRSRRGSISLHCGVPGRESPLSSDGVRRTRG